MALGGTGADKLLEVLPKNFNREVIIATDNDQAGEMALKNIAAALYSRGITFKKYAHRVDCKDINQELLKDKKIVDCIVFKSNFKTSKWAKPAWEPNTEYDWDWYVAKDSNGNWTVATYGYC